MSEYRIARAATDLEVKSWFGKEIDLNELHTKGVISFTGSPSIMSAPFLSYIGNTPPFTWQFDDAYAKEHRIESYELKSNTNKNESYCISHYFNQSGQTSLIVEKHELKKPGVPIKKDTICFALCSYNKHGQLTKSLFKRGVILQEHFYKYDSLQRLSSWTIEVRDDKGTLRQQVYTYEYNGIEQRVRWRIGEEWVNGKRALIVNTPDSINDLLFFDYDDEGRLQSARHIAMSSFDGRAKYFFRSMCWNRRSKRAVATMLEREDDVIYGTQSELPLSIWPNLRQYFTRQFISNNNIKTLDNMRAQRTTRTQSLYRRGGLYKRKTRQYSFTNGRPNGLLMPYDKLRLRKLDLKVKRIGTWWCMWMPRESDCYCVSTTDTLGIVNFKRIVLESHNSKHLRRRVLLQPDSVGKRPLEWRKVLDTPFAPKQARISYTSRQWHTDRNGLVSLSQVGGCSNTSCLSSDAATWRTVFHLIKRVQNRCGANLINLVSKAALPEVEGKSTAIVHYRIFPKR